MQPALQPLRNPSLDPLSAGDAEILLDNARQLLRIAETSPSTRLLSGKKIGLLCDSQDAGDALSFRSAATDLGAHVAHIRADLSSGSPPKVVRYTARMLGRLYDAIECQGLAPALVRQVGDEAGVPVFDAIASSVHPTAHLAARLDARRSPEQNRRLVLQAALISAIL